MAGQPSGAAVYSIMITDGLLLENSFRRRRIALDYFLPESDPAKKIQLIL
jgi:hypothetical protein